MVADRLPVLAHVVVGQRRALLGWAIALAAVTFMYVGLYPSMGASGQMEELVDQLPDAMVTAFGYDRIGTAAGWISTTVYGLIGPVLLLVFAIGTGARLIAGQEEDGTLELELTAPVGRRRLLAERLGALWVSVLLLVAVVAGVTTLLVVGLGLDVALGHLLAATTGLALLAGGFGTLALAVGAATGRRALALGSVAGTAVLAFVLDAIGPTLDAGWMTAISPFSWYLEDSPLSDGWDPQGLLLLALVPIVAAVGAFTAFERRDLGG